MPISKEQIYVEQAAELADGETLFIPVHTKKEQQSTHTRVNKLAKEYTSWVDTDIRLVVKKTFKDGSLWVAIEKSKAPKEVYVLESDKETVRRLQLKEE